MHYGGDYNPEQHPPDVWADDVISMREAGVNLVSLGIFSWSKIQPAEGQFEWDWLDTILELLHSNSISVDLATATASPPAWAVAAYPDLLPVDENGAIYWPGSRQHYAPTSPDYRRLAAALVRAIAARYADHPAVVMWHVNNEYGCHVNYDYSDHARDAFRRWLQVRYGDIESVNEAWGTAFWSQRLTAFDQIFPPRKAPTSPNPSALLDFKRFTSDALLELFVTERDILREAGATQPVTTNFMGAFPPLDYWKWAREVDFVSDDHYPDPNDPESFRLAAFTRDLMRSLKPGVPWVLMEQSTGALNWRPTNAPKAPGQMAALSVQAVGRGADGIMFFQWRQSRRGSEKFHSAMLPHAGKQTRIWREVVQLGADLAALPTLPPGPSHARVGLVFDWPNWWAISAADHPVVLDYLGLIQRWYAALHRAHIDVDFVQPISALGDYALILAPQLYLLEDDAAANLAGCVHGGGRLLVGAFSDVVDEHDAFRDGGFQVGLRDVLGLTVTEFGALVPPGSPGPGENFAPVAGEPGTFRGEYVAEELRLLGAEAIAHFAGGRRTGDPALTAHRFGAGTAHYLATIPDQAGTATIVTWLLGQTGILPTLPGLPESVEAARRGAVTTVINHGDRPVTVALPGTDLVRGHAHVESQLEPYDWLIIDT
jgi:beta-galactosidase